MTAVQLPEFLNQKIMIYGYLVTAKNTATSRGDRMCFGTFLDRNGRWIDTVHFPPSIKKWPFQGKGVYKITGKVVTEFHFLTVEVQQLERMHYVPDARFAGDQRKKKNPLPVDVEPFRLLR